MWPLRRWLHGNWFIPSISGVLILVALGLEHLADGRKNTVLSSRWWIEAGTHAEGTSSFALTDALMLAAAVVAGHRIVAAATRALGARFIGIDLLVSVAAIGAIVIGNFWEAAAVTLLFAVGNALETATMNRTRSALAELVATAPDTAIILREGQQIEVSARDVRVGETVLVKSGAKVPVDGVVAEGIAAVDESSITGESVPVEKAGGDRVFAGTISHGGLIQVEATGVGTNTALARIIHRVEEAQDAKARTQAFIDRFSKWYTPAVLLLALVTGLVTGDVVLALTLLVIGCPGALVISIPVALVAGIGRAARDGILIKGGEYLETASRVSAVALDKTGTLTRGRPVLRDVVVLDPAMDRRDVLRWAAAAEVGSEHPLARPVLEAAIGEGVAPAGVPELLRPVVGRGIVAKVGGTRVLVGNAALLQQEGITRCAEAARVADRFAAGGSTALIVAVDDSVAGVLAVADELRTDAPEMVRRLRDAGVQKVVMLTGDNRLVGEAIGHAAGIDEVHAQLLPEDKLEAIKRLQHQGHTVAMVGDGVNDAPALAVSDIGVAMGAAGSAVAVETADIALMGDNLLKLPGAIHLARRTTRVMRQNIVVALATVLVLLTGVFAGGLTMSAGMLVHEGSVLVVILNAMRLLRSGHIANEGTHARVEHQSAALRAATVI